VNPDTLRAVVVDDSALFRLLIRDALQRCDGVTIVATADNGASAIDTIARHKPDIVTLDVEMPVMDGIATLRALRARGLRPRVIMVSRHTAAGTQITTEALLEGAFDFIHKPSAADPASSRQQLQEELQRVLLAVRAAIAPVSTGSAARLMAPPGQSQPACELVLIGISTGGPDALRTMLPALPREFASPILIVQHMPPNYTARLASRLNDLCQLEVLEADEGMPLLPGRVLVAPGGRHLGVRKCGTRLLTTLSDAPPLHRCRPSVDFLLRSVFESAPQTITLNVIMTGMGADGTEGCALLKDSGGIVLAQAAEGCAVYGMPKAVIDAGLADHVVPLHQIADAIVRLAR
jgi:two-component system chemotaxis response regulator CheB